MALRNISQNLNVDDSLQPHFLKSSIKGSIQLSIADVATFLVSLVLGFGGNVTASSDKSDQRLSGNDYIKSFSLHQLKKADNHDTQCLICQYKSSCRTIEFLTIQHLINCPDSIYRRINQQIFKTTITPQLSNRCNIAG